MVSETPTGYYDRIRDGVQNYKKYLFIPGFPGQSAEMNELQTLILSKFEEFGNSIYRNGTWISGGTPSTQPGSPDGIDVLFTAGRIWANGEIHMVPTNGTGEPDTACNITGVGREVVFLELEEIIVTPEEDETLNDPATNSENYGLPGANRLDYSYNYVTTAGIPVATFIDGQLVTEPSVNALLDEIMKILAQRTREQSGSFVAERPTLSLTDRDDDYPTQLDLHIKDGIGYINGWRRQNGQVTIPVTRTLDGMERVAEPEPFLVGTKVYNLDNTPAQTIDQLLATIQSPTITQSRGQSLNTSDAIPSQYQPTLSIVSANQGGTVYVQNTDYVLSGNYITWLSGGNQPAPGTSYTMVVQYTKELTKGVRKDTRITAETQSVVAAACSTTYADLRRILEIVPTAGGDAFVEGTDYEVELHTGDITWLEDPGAIDVDITYDYWNHTTEGDYTFRDSFVDTADFPMPFATPSKTPTGLDIDYTSQVSFDVSGGLTPVNSSIFYMTYNFALPRIDLLVWQENGFLKVLQGLPSLDPDPPIPSGDQMPVVTLKIPAEATSSGVKFSWAPNLTLHVTELNYMKDRLNDIDYNLGRFQLAADANNRPTATDKRGIFADDLSSPELADLTHPDFAGSFDFLSRTFSLPRVRYEVSPTITSSGASLKGGSFWFPTYTETLMLDQPYSSGQKVLPGNPVPLQASVTLSPDHDTVLVKTTCEIKTTKKKCEIDKKDCKDHKFLRKASTVNKAATSFIDKARKKDDADDDFKSRFKNKVKDAWLERVQNLETNIRSKFEHMFDGDNNDEDDDKKKSDDHKYSIVLAHCNVVVGDDEVEAKTITATGRNFNANEGAITATFDDDPIVLTATGATVQETAQNYTSGVRANASGGWTATFQVPAGTKPGIYYVEFIGRNPADLSDVWNICEASYTAESDIRDHKKYIHKSCSSRKKKDHKKHHNKHSMICRLSHHLGLGSPSKNLRKTVGGPIKYTIAQAVAEANVQSGGTTSQSQVQTAVSSMYSYSYAKASASVSGYGTAIASAYAASCNGSTSAVAIAQVITNIPEATVPATVTESSVEELSLTLTDPLAQVFRVDTDPFITSIKLFFKTKPTTKPVTVSIATLDQNGVPTTEYLGSATVAAANIHTAGASTTFTFDEPIYVVSGSKYAFVVSCEEAIEIKHAVFGQKDETTGKIIVKSSAIDTLFESPKADTWQAVSPPTMLKFEIYRASFTNTQTILNLGKVTFPGQVSLIAMQVPFEIPSAGLYVTFQYSFNNSEWFDFQADIETELGNAYTDVWFRILLKHTEKMCPIVINAPTVEGFIYASPGAYVHREFSLPQQDSRYIDMFLDTYKPGGTSITCYVSYDQGAWQLLAEVEDDAIQITDKWIERHYTYDTGGSLKQDVRCKIVLASNSSYAAPEIAQIVVLAR